MRIEYTGETYKIVPGSMQAKKPADGDPASNMAAGPAGTGVESQREADQVDLHDPVDNSTQTESQSNSGKSSVDTSSSSGATVGSSDRSAADIHSRIRSQLVAAKVDVPVAFDDAPVQPAQARLDRAYFVKPAAQRTPAAINQSAIEQRLRIDVTA